MKTTLLSTLVLSLSAMLLASCSSDAPEEDAAPAVEITGQVNIYSSRHYDTDLALYDDFTAQTGIKVNRIEAGADALIERIVSEGEFSPADLLITVDAGRLWRAEEAGVLSPVESEVLTSRLPDNMRHPDGLWFGLSKRARIVIYNKEAGLPEGVSTYADLADPALKGMICVRSSSNVYNISLLASFVANDGAEAAEQWAAGVMANLAKPPQGNDTTHIASVAAGECRISIVNTYYLARFAAGNDGDRAIFDSIGVLFPNQESTGTHINISGAGVAPFAPNRDNAIRFLEYLTEDAAQGYFANGNNEYPAVIGVEASSAVEELGAFKEDNLNAAELGRNQAEAVRIYDRVGWQ